MESKLSMWTSFFIDLSPEETLAELASDGWRYAELSDEHSRTLLERGTPEASGAAFAAAARDHGVSLDQGHLDLPINIAPGDEGQRKQTIEGLKPWLDLYCAIGIRAGVLHPGRGDDAELSDAQRLRSLEEISRHLEGTDLVICLENCSSGEALMPILAATDPDRVGVCLDTGHLNLTNESQGDFIRAVGPRLRALHLAENAGQMDEHAMPFARGGSVPWEEIAIALRETGYAGLLNYEVPGERICPLEVRRLKLKYLEDLSEWVFGDREGTSG